MIEATGIRRHERAQAQRLGGVCFLILLLLGGLSGCQTIKISSDWDPQFDFTRLQTWKWAADAQMRTGNQVFDTDGLLSRRVMSAIAQNLKSRGYVETETSQADFEVTWFFTVEDRTNVRTVNDYHGYGGAGYGWYGGGYSTSRTMVDHYQQGTLIIDVKADETGELIWRGSGTARLREERSDPATEQATANEAVAAILAKFPPPSNSDSDK